jgi:hypothetical protein
VNGNYIYRKKYQNRDATSFLEIGEILSTACISIIHSEHFIIQYYNTPFILSVILLLYAKLKNPQISQKQQTHFQVHVLPLKNHFKTITTNIFYIDLELYGLARELFTPKKRHKVCFD